MSAAVFRTRATQRRSVLLAGYPSPLDPQLNGIDYLEVYGAASAAVLAEPGISDRSCVLRLHFLQEVWLDTLVPAQVVIRGGRRIPDVSVARLHRGALASEGDARDLWALVLDSGDWSMYTLELVVEPQSARPPQGFDPVLSRVEFSFKVDCPSNLDCVPMVAERQDSAAGPAIDYLGRDYQAFRTLMLDRMATVAPGWTERNVADLGVAIVEVVAHVADGLSYYQDAVATEAYLATARRRTSVRRHARLLDYRMHEGSAARTFVSIQVAAGLDGEVLPAGARLLTQVAGAPAGIRASQPLAAESLVFETLHDRLLRVAGNVLFVHTWGEDDLVLPAGTTRATLIDPGPGVLTKGDVLVFVEQYGADPDDPTTGAQHFADPARRHAVRLIADPTSGEADPLFETLPIVEVSWHARDALPFDVCLTVFDRPTGDDAQGYRDADKVVSTVLLGNVVLADHGRTFGAPPDEPEELPGPIAGSRYRPALARRHIAHCVPYHPALGARSPAIDALAIDPKDAQPAVELSSDDGRTWVARYDLLASDGDAEEFVVEMQEDRRAVLRFGDGEHGRTVDGGAALRAVYRVGGGFAGNVAAGAIQHLVLSDDKAPSVLAVTNPLAARGGSDPESIDRVKRLAPEAFKKLERAVRPEDYRELAERHPEVQRAVASFRWTGSWRTVRVTVDRKGGRAVDADFQRELVAYLEPVRMAGHDLQVRAPTFVALHVGLTVTVEATRIAAEVERAIRVVLGTGGLSDGTLGFFHPDRLSFGQSIYLSQLIATVMGVSGVARVDVTRRRTVFERFEDAASNGLAEGRLRFGPLEIPRLDADPNAPENGRLDLYMEGGI